jgi:hypothetical protein
MKGVGYTEPAAYTSGLVVPIDPQHRRFRAPHALPLDCLEDCATTTNIGDPMARNFGRYFLSFICGGRIRTARHT